MKIIRRKYKIKNVIIITFILVCFLLVIYSLFKIFVWKKDVNKNNTIKEEIKEYVTIVEEDDNSGDKKDIYQVDFAKLKERNSDTVGYIKVKGTNIDYPVVKAKDNSYYLNHNFYKEYNSAGWIFADYRNKYDGTDRNLVIYGHNMRDGSMFGSMSIILDGTWQNTEGFRYITLITTYENMVYEVFSTYVIEPEEYYITTDFASDQEYLEFLNKVKARSNYNYGVSVSESDKILTLSSCSFDGKKRVVLHAKAS